MISKFLIPILLFSYLSLTHASATAAEAKTEEWSWKLDSADLMESKISILVGKKLLASYFVGCDLSDALSREIQEEEENPGKVDKIVSPAFPDGILLVTCIVGAHSQNISIFDPKVNSKEAVFSKTGSYYAGWEIKNGQLVIFYDRPCDAKQKNCEYYQKISVEWPPQAVKN